MAATRPTLRARLRTEWRKGDDELIVRLHRAGYQDFDDRFTGARLEAMIASVEVMIAEAGLGPHSAHRLWFAEIDERTVGCVGLVRRGRQGQLRWLVLLDEARGHGLGRQLVQAVLDEARRQGLEEVYLKTVRGLDASMALYERFGFQRERDVETDLWHGRGHEVTMRLQLTAPPQ